MQIDWIVFIYEFSEAEVLRTRLKAKIDWKAANDELKAIMSDSGRQARPIVSGQIR
jgi:hypothetical protein